MYFIEQKILLEKKFIGYPTSIFFYHGEHLDTTEKVIDSLLKTMS